MANLTISVFHPYYLAPSDKRFNPSEVQIKLLNNNTLAVSISLNRKKWEETLTLKFEIYGQMFYTYHFAMWLNSILISLRNTGYHILPFSFNSLEM